MNFTQFWKIYNNSNVVVDTTDKYEMLASIEPHSTPPPILINSRFFHIP